MIKGVFCSSRGLNSQCRFLYGGIGEIGGEVRNLVKFIGFRLFWSSNRMLFGPLVFAIPNIS